MKVEELLFGSDGYLLIAGFGLAKVVDDRTHTLCGTPQVKFSIIYVDLGYRSNHDMNFSYSSTWLPKLSWEGSTPKVSIIGPWVF